MAENVLSMTMVGKAFCLCGTAYYRCRGPESLTKDLKPDEVPLYITFGTDGSWYRCSKPRDPKKGDSNTITLSPNFPTHYPALTKTLSSLKLTDTPQPLCLGPQGRYFAQIGTKKLWRLPRSVEAYLGDLAEYEAVWMGKGETYVAVRKGGGCSVDLKGRYGGLREEIKANGAPKIVAMNFEDDEEWIAVWPNGRYSRRTGRTCLPSEDANTFFETMGFKTK